MGSDRCNCCWWNMCRVPKDDGQDNWLCQECVDKCPPGDWDNCVVRPRTPEANPSLSAPTAPTSDFK